MIIDTLDNLARYESLYPLIAEVVAFMKTTTWRVSKPECIPSRERLLM